MPFKIHFFLDHCLIRCKLKPRYNLASHRLSIYWLRGGMRSSVEEAEGGRQEDKGKQRIRGGEVTAESTSEGTSYSAFTMKDLVSKVPSEERSGLLGILFHLAVPSAAWTAEQSGSQGWRSETQKCWLRRQRLCPSSRSRIPEVTQKLLLFPLVLHSMSQDPGRMKPVPPPNNSKAESY